MRSRLGGYSLFAVSQSLPLPALRTMLAAQRIALGILLIACVTLVAGEHAKGSGIEAASRNDTQKDTSTSLATAASTKRKEEKIERDRPMRYL